MNFSPLRAFAWLFYAGVGILFLVYGIYAILLPSLQPDHWVFLTFDGDTVDYISGIFRWLGMISFGFGFLTVAISITSFRRGERWTWYAFWFFPLFFLLAIPFTWPGLAWIPFVLLSAAALIITSRQVFTDRDSSSVEEAISR